MCVIVMLGGHQYCEYVWKTGMVNNSGAHRLHYNWNFRLHYLDLRIILPSLMSI
jgi:hypothetical protein